MGDRVRGSVYADAFVHLQEVGGTGRKGGEEGEGRSSV